MKGKSKVFLIMFVLMIMNTCWVAAETKITQAVFFPQYTKDKLSMSKSLDAIWQKAPQVELKDYKTGEQPKKKTVVRTLYDNDFLYIVFECEEPEPKKLKVECTERDQAVWRDDCVEVFLSSFQQGTPYAHFIVSAAGVICDLWDRNSGWNPDYEVVAWSGTQDWWVKLKIPFKLFETTPQTAPIWKANFCREEKGLGELTSWRKAANGFNDPTSFGDLAFITPEEYASSQKIVNPKVPLNESGYVIWKESPLKTSFVDSKPEDLFNDCKSLQVKVCQNQKTCAKVMVTNLSEVSLTFRVEPFEIKQLDKKSTEYDFHRLFTFKEAIPRHNSHYQRQLDPLCRLNEGNIISIPAFETRALWIDIKGQLPPGQYQSTIAFIPVDNNKPSKKVTLNVNILDFKFPEVLPVDTFLWGPAVTSNGTWPNNRVIGKEEAYYGVASEYHLKYLHAIFPTSAIEGGPNGPVINKGREHYLNDALLAAKKNGKIIYSSAGFFMDFDKRIRARGFSGPIFEEQWVELFTEWINTWFGYLKEVGLTFDDFMIQIIDEPRADDIEGVYRCGKLLKEIAPELRIMCDIAAWSTIEEIKRLDPVIDFWVPYEQRLHSVPTAEEELKFFQSTGKPFAPYLCSVRNDVQPLLGYYRFRGIRSWLLGASGIFMWPFNYWRGNSWDPSDVIKDSGAKDEGIFYHGDYGPIPSVRGEALREGIEDYYLISIANEKLKAGTLPAEAAMLISEEYLKKLMSNNNPDEVEEWQNLLASYL